MRLVFGIAFAVLFSTIGVSIFVINKLTDTGTWVAHTHEVIAKINEVEVYFGSLRVSTKNYMLTHKPRHLAPRINGIQLVDQCMSRLTSLTIDNPFQQGQVANAWRELRGYVELTNKMIEDIDSGAPQEENLPAWMDETAESSRRVASCMQRMRDEENRLLVVRDKQATSFVNQAYSTLPVMLLLQVVVTAYIYQRVLHQCQSESRG